MVLFTVKIYLYGAQAITNAPTGYTIGTSSGCRWCALGGTSVAGNKMKPNGTALWAMEMQGNELDQPCQMDKGIMMEALANLTTKLISGLLTDIWLHWITMLEL